MYDILSETTDMQPQPVSEAGADPIDYDIPTDAITETATKAEASSGDDAAEEVAIAAPDGWTEDNETAKDTASGETPERVGALVMRHDADASHDTADSDADIEQVPEQSGQVEADIPAAEQEPADRPDDTDAEADSGTEELSDVVTRQISTEFRNVGYDRQQSESRSVALRRAGRADAAGDQKPRSSSAATIQAMDKRMRTMGGGSMAEVASHLGPEVSQNYHLLANPSLSNRDVAKMTQFTRWQVGSLRRRIVGSVLFNNTGEHHKTYTQSVRYGAGKQSAA